MPVRNLVTFAVIGFLIAHVWEVLQMPFFEPGDLTPYDRALRCSAASVGDGLILALAAWVAGRVDGNQFWFEKPSIRALAAYFGFGLAVAVGVEMLATNLPQDSILSWRYSSAMPLIPGLSLALVPVIMWIVVPAATLALARFTRS